MKILGIYDGRKGGVSELLVKQALLGAKENGAEVEAVNVRDLNIKPCINCNYCHNPFTAAVGNCKLKDDLNWIDEKIMACDGLVVVMPAYEKAPPGEFKLLLDRTGPSHDVAFRKMAKEKRLAEPEKYSAETVDERSFKKRYVTFIAHGGSEWTHLCLPTMMGWAVSLGLTIADKLLFQWNVGLEFDSDRLARTKRSGAYVAECCASPEAEHAYIGDAGMCPECHNDVLVVDHNTGELECTVCGLKGTLGKNADGSVTMIATNEQRVRSHMRLSGCLIHYQDIMNNIGKAMGIDREASKRITEPICSAIESSKPERE